MRCEKTEKRGTGIVSKANTRGNGGHGYDFEDLTLGMEASHRKTITASDIEAFADLSGDDNPVHLCDAFASGTVFKERIAHGILTASLLSTVLGTKLPGPGCIYLRQDLRFKAPVKVGDTVEARVTVKEIQAEKKRVVFDTVCSVVGGRVVLEGEATLMVHSRQDLPVSPEEPQAAE